MSQTATLLRKAAPRMAASGPSRLGARIRALDARGHVLQERGRYREAERVLRKALTLAERAFGPEALEVATALNNLAVCYKYLARFLDAGPLYQRALNIMEDRLGRDHPDVATVYHNLGGLEHAAGNWSRGEPFARESVRIRARALGWRSPETAADMAALAALLDRQKKYAEAERLYRRALAVFEHRYGPDHPEVAVSLNNLAAIHQARGRPRQAEALYRRALAIDRVHLGPYHPKVAFCANNLAVLLNARGRTDESAQLFRRALAVFARAFGPRHPNVGACLENYGEALRRLNRHREAAACARRAQRILRRVEAVNDEGIALTGTINPLYARFRLMARPSLIHRLGVFAEEPIPARCSVIEYTGERISRGEAGRRWDPARSYLVELNAYWRLDGAIGGSGAEYINHSCAPNLQVRRLRGHILYFSRRPIAKGEELTVDYQYSADLNPMPCRCGAPACRGTMNLPRHRVLPNATRRQQPRAPRR